MSFARWASWVFALAAFFAAVPLARAAEPKGLAVVATDGATDAAWPLAQAIYGSALRPDAIDDARARVLAGESPKAGAPDDLASLAELRAGVKGDDAASRAVLATLAQRLSVVAIVVVSPGTPPVAGSAAGGTAQTPSARVYDAGRHAFDAARYVSDPDWKGAVASIQRAYGPPAPLPAVVKAPPAAVAPTPEAPRKKSESKAFWESPWFWVAVGAAALIGGGVLIATNVQTSDTIHLQMRLP